MNIDKQTIAKLESLALLKLSAEEKTALTKDLNGLVDMINKLQNVDTEGIEPLISPNEHCEKTLKEDIKGQQLSATHVLQNAKEQSPPFFTVPKVINKDS